MGLEVITIHVLKFGKMKRSSLVLGMLYFISTMYMTILGYNFYLNTS